MSATNPVRESSAEVLIEARRVYFAYEANQWVVNDVSLQLKRGTLAALIGANGSGKSTLIRLLAGLRSANSGEITLEGRSLERIPRKGLARSLAYVPQINPMIFPFTAIEVVLTGRSPYTPRFRFENRSDVEKSMEALDTVGGAHLARRPVTELSGGRETNGGLRQSLGPGAGVFDSGRTVSSAGPQTSGGAYPYPAPLT